MIGVSSLRLMRPCRFGAQLCHEHGPRRALINCRVPMRAVRLGVQRGGIYLPFGRAFGLASVLGFVNGALSHALPKQGKSYQNQNGVQ